MTIFVITVSDDMDANQHNGMFEDLEDVLKDWGFKGKVISSDSE